MLLTYRHGTTTSKVNLPRPAQQGDVLDVGVDGETYRIEVVRIDADGVVFRCNGELVEARCAIAGDRRFVHCSGGFPVALTKDDGSAKSRARGTHGGGLEATMHSQVIAVAAQVGARVKRGEVLVTLEAMKMEMRIAAPHDGVVKAVSCKPGEVVERGRVLVELEAVAD